MSVTIKNIQKSFGSKKVLNGVDYTLEDDGIYCLMGPSGMGKTTLLRILMDLETPDAGEIQGLGEDDISAMFQEDRLFHWLSAVDNVAVVCKKMKDKKAKRQIAENLECILPKDCLYQPISELSGGMKRRVALARAMNFPSRLIILDEPFTGLDRETKMNVIDYILKMRGHRILLVATHGVDDADLLGAKVIRLEELQGKTVQEEQSEEEDVERTLSRSEILKEMDLFQGIAESSFEDIIHKMGGYESEYSTDEIVWRQAAEKNCIGIILKGRIQAEKIFEKEIQIIEQFRSGDCFGAAVALGSKGSWVEIRAIKPTKILFLPVSRFLTDLDDRNFNQMKTNLVREMSNKLEILNLKNQLLAEPRLRNRILMYLCTLPEDADGFKTVPFSQKELAQYLNANRSAFSREMTRMREDKVIETAKRRVKVLQQMSDFEY